MKQNISIISKEYMCSACGACIIVCKKNAIELKSSIMGRLFAVVEGNCVNCGLCLKVCPSYKADYSLEDYISLDKLRIAIGKATDNDIYRNSQSGGAVTAILQYLFEFHLIDAALVCKNGKANIITEESELKNSQKSEYTTIPLLTELSKITFYKSVAVVGLPCHITALTNIMKHKKIPVNYKLGLICDRTLCCGIKNGIQNYLKIDRDYSIIQWRNKEAGIGFGYKNAPITIEVQGKQKMILPSRIRQKLKLMFTAPRCLCCPDKLNLNADIVFGDPWNIDIPYDNGASLIIVNTIKGVSILNNAVQAGYVSIARECSREELNRSQHIIERKGQVLVYSKILRASNNTSYLLKFKQKHKKSIRETINALLTILRFRILERLPGSIVKRYTIRLIKNADTENGES